MDRQTHINELEIDDNNNGEKCVVKNDVSSLPNWTPSCTGLINVPLG